MNRKNLVALVAVILAVMFGAGALVAAASATPPGDKVGVCHRTAAETNPYVYIEVPADEANGHVTGTDKQHNHKVYWESDGTWRGVPHQAGDERMDYLAPGGAADCTDTGTTPPPPGGDECPEGETDYNGSEPGCGTPPDGGEECPEGDLNGEQPGCEAPETPGPPSEEEPEPPVLPDTDVEPDHEVAPGGDDERSNQPADQPVAVPTAVAAGK